MLIRFTDDYEKYIFAARNLVGRIIGEIGEKEPFLGSSIALDKLYALSVVITGIIDCLEYYKNDDTDYNEQLLNILKELLSKNLCEINNRIPEEIISLLPLPVDTNNFQPK